MSGTRTVLIGLGIVICAATPGARQDTAEIPIDWRFAGSFMQNLARTAPAPAPPATIVGRTAAILLEAKGSPGPASIRVFNGGGSAVQPPDGIAAPEDPRVCEGLATGVIGGENGLIATLSSDLSVLYGVRDASIQSYNCTDASGVNHGAIYLVFVGGTGRFAGATGRAVIAFDAKPIVPGSSLLAETGTLRGLVHVAND